MNETEVKKERQMGFLLLSYFAIFLTYSIVLGVATMIFDGADTEFKLGIIALSQVFLFLGLTVFFAKKLPSPLNETFRLKMPKDNIVFLWAFIGLVGLQLFSSGIIPLQNTVLPEFLSSFFREAYQNYIERFKEMFGTPSFSTLFYALFAVSLVPGVVEELVFRGYLQKSLERQYSAKFSIIFVAFIFAMTHASLEVFVSLFAAGLLLGTFAFKTGSIYPSMMIHILLNASSIIIMQFFSDDISAIEDPMQYSPGKIATYISLLIAGIALMIVSIRYLPKSENEIEAFSEEPSELS